MKKKKKGEKFLKFIIAYKGLIGLFELALSISLLNHLGDSVEDTFTSLAVSMNLDTDHQIISSAIKKAGVLGNGMFIWITAGIFAFGVMNIIEAAGLHFRQRWAEWLTVVATGLFIPFELYEVIEKVTVLRVAILLLNIAIVYYLAKHKELFKRKAMAHRAPSA
ncbi:MAG TPA: hypothetical protein DDW94_08640 [Deltaproteobacteria bacterium]|nr:MAG: hypothetical protein A2Z79_03155 [Deltaproteobacteria bacterium GWA2_55_82]OGQ62280.1 MAG: hypothetical protein A3I81_05065 [Deltaproteobacteria bacterium RIFCSPLOWO2_02_FULL_55_12]OIJ74392.1 MAG: hypothetical protein A2V21_309055 [Deltaproteobacteria bacterium GWC2_55_46]HBG47041.1 hypothetical protein [Deltaproteobacteria bacterium]HCY10899.1 hypothetical protein [Deltaproteobacteria bacterium]